MEILEISDGEKTYRFEKPEFECGLLAIVGGFIMGWFKLKDTECLAQQWDLYGNCFEGHDYNLTPIKPKWYEEEANFPALIKGAKGFFVVDELSSIGIHNIEDRSIRLATKDELMSLYYDKE